MTVSSQSNAAIKKNQTLEMLPLEYWMQFQLAIFSKNPQPGEGTVKRCPGKWYELEELQESRG